MLQVEIIYCNNLKQIYRPNKFQYSYQKKRLLFVKRYYSKLLSQQRDNKKSLIKNKTKIFYLSKIEYQCKNE
ncbi:hypothetical protein TTHERM_001558033 (macronuclear) [Tetrahymena thermophila SB210]|uniref:Uncharacterized protein n=1 Tax=Tetrahymena thermophila (strain SB210) TaxID=312017 RepID=W7XF61_TETTS|nr:hypothetical protein TTHERM_001558033 [Tetrahymena thermophila SB210]EWS76437.1 hypothetical protein TTHERM_001558033 [Tetrahymena thermophila SB210]|eukprot:XP_012651029.1 hypothetical protein TTHERM_001558033 [Tetrahymena thermophila SB210]